MNLRELISEHRAGRSYSELERDCGGSPSAKRLQQMATQPIKNFPDPPSVQALSRGLRVSEVAVVLAAAESLGLDVESSMPRLVQLLPSSASEMTEQQAAAVAHLIKVFMPADLAWPDVEISIEPDPTVRDVLEARARQQQLRPVAKGGDRADVERVEDLAKEARRRQQPKGKTDE